MRKLLVSVFICVLTLSSILCPAIASARTTTHHITTTHRTYTRHTTTRKATIHRATTYHAKTTAHRAYKPKTATTHRTYKKRK